MSRFDQHWPMISRTLVIVLLSFSMLGNNLFNRKTLLVLLIIGMYSCRNKLTTLVANSFKLWPLLFILGWCLLSQYWSRWPQETISAVFIQILMVLMCFSLAECFGTKTMKQLLTSAAILAIIVNLTYIIIQPSAAFTDKGLVSFYYSKNNTGLVMAICSILLLFAPVTKYKWWLFGISFSLLIATNSKTSLALFILCSTLTWLITCGKSTPHPKYQLLTYIGSQLIGLGAILYLTAHQEVLLDYVYYQLDDELMTGRGKLWSTMLLHAEHHLNYGLGYEAVWVGSESSEIYYTDLLETAPLWIEKIVSSDGGYIDILVATGFVGLGLTLSLFIHCAFLVFNNRQRAELAPFIAIFLFTIGHNITESTLLLSTNMLWLFFLLSIFSIANPVNVSTSEHQPTRVTMTKANKFG